MLLEPLRYSADFLDRPADERARFLWMGILVFWCRLVCLISDGRHHGKGHHDEGDMAMPAMPRPCFVVIKPELVLRSLKAVFDRPAVTFHCHQRFNRSSRRAPGGKVGKFTIFDVLP